MIFLDLPKRILQKISEAFAREYSFSFALTFLLGFFVPIVSIVSLVFWKSRLLCFIMVLGFVCGFLHHSFFYKKNLSMGTGHGVFTIDTYKHTYFGAKLLCLGHVDWTDFEGKIFKNIPISIRSKTHQRLSSNYSYAIQGNLCKKGPYLEVVCNSIKPYQKKFSLVETRLFFKKKLSHLWKTHIKNKELTHLFQALFSGEMEDPMLYFLFQKIGLAHLLVISGFHLSFLTFILMLFLKPFIAHKKTFWLILALLSTLYFLFIGINPSLMRAYLMGLIFFLAHIFSRPYSSFNALGIAFVISLILFPEWIDNLGFQLSFLATSAILLTYYPLSALLSRFFPSKPKTELSDYTLLSRVAYRMIFFIKPLSIISLGVNLFLFPYLLYLFHSFALLGFVYNLFVPLLVEAILLLLMIFLVVHFVCPILHFFVDPLLSTLGQYTLNLLYNVPAHLDVKIFSSSFPFFYVAIYWMLLVLVCLCVKKSSVQRNLI